MEQKRKSGGRFALYALIILAVVGAVAAYMLHDMHQRNVETGEQLNKIADQMERDR